MAPAISHGKLQNRQGARIGGEANRQELNQQRDRGVQSEPPDSSTDSTSSCRSNRPSNRCANRPESSTLKPSNDAQAAVERFDHSPGRGVNRNKSVTVRGAPNRECAHWIASCRVLLPSFTIHDHGILGIMEYMRHICAEYLRAWRHIVQQTFSKVQLGAFATMEPSPFSQTVSITFVLH